MLAISWYCSPSTYAEDDLLLIGIQHADSLRELRGCQRMYAGRKSAPIPRARRDAPRADDAGSSALRGDTEEPGSKEGFSRS